ncbi:DUF2959 family protein [Pseudomonas typographi]|uniref:DUF2959 domain-containing protein n=1 Tax=Pseudomonas typographi TaxID=2715964 RepID=A0ABR7YWJ9_9PSED|nr:DUF2959 family protein [Pseudomonas typographi]MBD1585519.1 DUF2959 domain-containing protein [Pseudomonas typographi]MBD1597566.1 DUF2959 domain-containing protein [Pseudomonas typographi]
MRYLLLFTALLLAGCQSPYLSMMEKAGIPKREIFSHRVEDARDAQIKARYQFNRTLEHYRLALAAQEGDPQQRYAELERDYAASQKAAQAVEPRVNQVEQVAEAMFREWEDELNDYQTPALRQASAQELAQTREQYQLLLAKMRDAQSRVLPALGALNDQLLFYKHHMNAQTVGNLQQGYSTVSGTVEPLLIDLQRSIEGANGLIQRLQSP